LGHFEQYNFLELHNLSVPLFDFAFVVVLEFVDNTVEAVFDDVGPAGDKIAVDIDSALEESPFEYFVVVFGCEASFDFDDTDFEKDDLVVDRIEIYFDEAETAEEGGFADQNMVGNAYFGYFFEELLVHIVDFVEEYFDFLFELADYLFGLYFHLLFHRK
jgi:hypothetical protein